MLIKPTCKFPCDECESKQAAAILESEQTTDLGQLEGNSVLRESTEGRLNMQEIRRGG